MKKPTLEQINELVPAFKGHPEHYKLLAWVSLQYNDITIVEIGTHKGYGTEALSYNKRNKVISFDIKTREGSLGTPYNAEKEMVYPEYMDEVVQASIIFYDAKHEGKEEQEFFDELVKRDWRGILLLDDIHFNEPMSKFWEGITLTKEDWTDIGHSPSGTGAVFFYKDMVKNDLPYDYFLEKIRNNIPFKFMRFGDGEFHVSTGNTKKSIGKGEHAVFPEITEDVRNILKEMKPETNVYYGLQRMSIRLVNINMWIPHFDWCNSDVFHHANEQGRLPELFEALKGKNVVIVSSAKLRPVNKYVDYSDFIEIREKDSWWDKDMVMEKIDTYPAGTVFLLCASRLSTPLIYHTKRKDCTFIDLGSALDPYVSISSRTYHQNVIDKLT